MVRIRRRCGEGCSSGGGTGGGAGGAGGGGGGAGAAEAGAARQTAPTTPRHNTLHLSRTSLGNMHIIYSPVHRGLNSAAIYIGIIFPYVKLR